MRAVLRLQLLLWALGVIASTTAMVLPRLQASDEVSHWLLYTNQNSGGVTSIYRVRPVPSAPQRLGAFGEVLFPCWSPDGKWIAFFASGRGEAGQNRPEYHKTTLYRMRADGGDLETILPPTDAPLTPMNLMWSAEGPYLQWEVLLGEMILAGDTTGNSARTLVTTSFRVHLGNGEVEYWHQGGGTPDGRWEPAGDITTNPLSMRAIPVQTTPLSASSDLVTATTGEWSVMYRPDAASPGVYRVQAQSDGSPEIERNGDLLLAGQLTGMARSPDGESVIVALMGPGGGKVYRVDVSGGTVTQLVRDSPQYHTMDVAPSPDGRWVAIVANRVNSGGVRVLAADSEGLRSLESLSLLAGGAGQYHTLAWSPPESQRVRWWIPLALGIGSLIVSGGLYVRSGSAARQRQKGRVEVLTIRTTTHAICADVDGRLEKPFYQQGRRSVDFPRSSMTVKDSDIE